MTKKSGSLLDAVLLSGKRGSEEFSSDNSDIFFHHDDLLVTDNDLSDNKNWVYVPDATVSTDILVNGYGELWFDADSNPHLSEFIYNFIKPIPNISLMITKHEASNHLCLLLGIRISVFTGVGSKVAFSSTELDTDMFQNMTSICQFKVTSVKNSVLPYESLPARKRSYTSLLPANHIWNHFKNKLSSDGES